MADEHPESSNPEADNSRAWISCVSGVAACAWDVSTGKRLKASAPLPQPPCFVHYGGCPGDVGYERLSADALGAKLGFEMISSLIVLSPRYHRELPLYNLPEDAISEQSLPPAAGPSTEELQRLIRQCVSNPDVYVAPDTHGGHGLFAAAPLPAYTYIGEYVGTLVSSTPHQGQDESHGSRGVEGEVDQYLMRYPDAAGRKYISGWRAGSLARFANHSASGNPDCNSCMYVVLCDGSWHQIMLTTRAVCCREELRHDYGPQFWSGRVQCPC